MPTTTTTAPHHAACPPLHLRLREKLDTTTERLALRAALTAAHLLGLATGRLLRDLRSKNDPLAEAVAQLKEAELKASLAWEIVEILGTRLDKIPERHRPYFTPTHVFRSSRSRTTWAGTETSRRSSSASARTRSRIGRSKPTPWRGPWAPRSRLFPPSCASPTSAAGSSSPCSRSESVAKT